MGGVSRIKKKMNVATEQKAALVPTGFSYDGCQVLMLVPWDNDKPPTQVAQEFSQQTREMYQRATVPNLNDLWIATLAMQKKIGTENFRILDN